MYLLSSLCKCDLAASIKFHLEILAKSAARSLGPCYPQAMTRPYNTVQLLQQHTFLISNIQGNIRAWYNLIIIALTLVCFNHYSYMT